MYQAIQKLKNRDVNGTDIKLLFPLLTLCSNYEPNISVCKSINRDFFTVDKQILLKHLSLGITPTNYIQYPKGKKVDNGKFDLICSYLVKKYNYGKSDFISMRKIIENYMKDTNNLERFCNQFGISDKERKVLGLKIEKIKKPVKVVKKNEGLLKW